MKEHKNKILLALICVFFISLGLTIAVGFSDQQEPSMLIKAVIPAYDEESTVVVSDNGVVFNDKNQEVKYKVVIENPNDYDVKVSDIILSTPSEDFLEYEVENLNKDDVINANGTKELVVSFNTVKKEGWGRNFADELTANVTFAKVTKLEEPKPTPEPEKPKEEVKEEEKKEPVVENNPVVEEEQKGEIVVPVKDSEEIKQNFTLIETFEIEEDEIVFNKIENVVDKQKIDVWIYSEPIYLGRFEVEVKDGKTKILGLSEALEKQNIETGNHSLVMQTETGEKIGYVEVKINNKKFEKIVQEETVPEEDVSNNVEDVVTIDKDEKEETNKDNKVLLVVLITLTAVTGTAIVVILVVNKKKKTVAAIAILLSGISLVKADVLIELPITFNVSFESQNVMQKSYSMLDEDGEPDEWNTFWMYNEKIRDIYIQNEIIPIENVSLEFDVSNEPGKGRVKAYLVKNNDYNNLYDLYLQADGIIYPNEDASYYFAYMEEIGNIDNLKGLDTSNVTNMSYMFANTGCESSEFVLDLGENFDTSKVTDMSYMFFRAGERADVFNLNLGDKFDTSNVTDMSSMFESAGDRSETFVLDVSNLNTSKVINMRSMFDSAGCGSEEVVLDVSNFDTSKVTDMSNMFRYVGYHSISLELDVSNFDTSNVTNMSGMFRETGNKKATQYTLDVSNFDTSNVKDMSKMFDGAGVVSTNFTLDVSNFDTSNVTNMSGMFSEAGYNSTNFTLDVSNFDTSKVTDMSSMFYHSGNSNPDFELDVSHFDTSNVTDMRYMFDGTGRKNTNFILDVSNFDTSKVTNMGCMFRDTGYRSTKLSLDVSNFDMSNVSYLSKMFENAGYNSTKFNTVFTIRKTITIEYNYQELFDGVATKEGSQIVVNYTRETVDFIDKAIATKSANSNVVKGICIDCD